MIIIIYEVDYGHTIYKSTEIWEPIIWFKEKESNITFIMLPALKTTQPYNIFSTTEAAITLAKVFH